MSNRYQKPTDPDRDAGSIFGKGGIGALWAAICARLGIGGGQRESTAGMPDAAAGYQIQGGFEDEDDGRILRHRPNSSFNPMTGTYIMRNSAPPKRRKLWPWVVLGFAAIGLYFLAFSPGDPVNKPPADSPPAVGALANAGGPTDHAGQDAAIMGAYMSTPTPTPYVPRTPAPSPAPTPAPTSSVLKYGSKGEAVKNLQGQLIALGYMALGTDDGAFGDVTQGAALSFQKVNGLEADGIVGEKTLALLSGGTAKEDPDVFVWVTSKGKEYHSDKDCSDIKDPKQIKKSKAEKQKLKPCTKCN